MPSSPAAPRSFSANVLACLPKMPWTITKEDEQKRKDLRGLNICSIDPPGCTDIDDALHLRDLPNGNFEVWGCVSLSPARGTQVSPLV